MSSPTFFVFVTPFFGQGNFHLCFLSPSEFLTFTNLPPLAQPMPSFRLNFVKMVSALEKNWVKATDFGPCVIYFFSRTNVLHELRHSAMTHSFAIRSSLRLWFIRISPMDSWNLGTGQDSQTLKSWKSMLGLASPPNAVLFSLSRTFYLRLECCVGNT